MEWRQRVFPEVARWTKDRISAGAWTAVRRVRTTAWLAEATVPRGPSQDPSRRADCPESFDRLEIVRGANVHRLRRADQVVPPA